MKRTLTLATLFALGAAAFAPLPSMAQTSYSVVISSGPPAPLYERVPAARHGYDWAPGHWEWRRHRHHWVPGHWVAARPGYVYVAPAWHRRDGGWYMAPGHWSAHHGYRYGRGPGRDRDHNGVPDRIQRRYDRDFDGVPNHHDRDRDGDGVPNRHDRDPDSWRRY